MPRTVPLLLPMPTLMNIVLALLMLCLSFAAYYESDMLLVAHFPPAEDCLFSGMLITL
jgi:hypothetical protein